MIEEAGDLDTMEAVAKATAEVHRSWRTADVYRFNGLTVTDSEGRGLHFQTALCGYIGSGPNATATILELLGFGEKDALLPLVQNNEVYSLQKPA